MIEKKPNLIWIFGDQHRGQALGCSGDPNVNTPNIDRLASEGLNFPNAVAGTPLCCPFRGSLLTGLYPHLCVPGHEDALHEDQKTVAHAFKDSGYLTTYIGKWHLDGFRERTGGRAAMHIVPPHRRGGFDEWIGYENNNSQWDCWVHGGEDGGAFHERLPSYETDALTDLFITYIKQRGQDPEQPFFGALSVQPPHIPYVAPPEWMQRHTPGGVTLRANVPNIPRVEETARQKLAGYYAMIENLDWNLGRIRTALEEAEMSHDTHIVFFSDHGAMLGSHGHWGKTTPYVESIRIPFIVGGHVPRYENFGGKSNQPVNHVDIAPTSLGLCGIEPPDWMMGTDYSGLRVKGRDSRKFPDSAFLQLPSGPGYLDCATHPWRGVTTTDGWKYTVTEGGPWTLHNLNEDPFELVNGAFSGQYRSEKRQLHDRLSRWIADTDDQFRMPEV